MANGFLLIGSNDVGFAELGWLSEGGVDAAYGELGYSGGAIRRLHDERFEVRVVRLDDVIAELKMRAASGVGRIDGVCLMSCRPYGDGSELREPAAHLRALQDHYQAFPHIPARVLPIVQSDIKHAMAGLPTDLGDSRWRATVPVAPGSDPRDVAGNLESLPERTMDCLFRLVRSWRLDLMLDLEAGGLIIARAPDGSLRPRVALRRKPTGGAMHLAGFHPVAAHARGLPIFAADLDVDREPFAAFFDLLQGDYRRYAQMDRTKTEIALHRFLDENPQLLRSETYTEFLTETAFSIRNGKRSSMRPDLILRPVDCRSTSFRIVELKLPSHPVVVRDKNGERFSRAVLRAIEQVRAYRDRLTDPAHTTEVMRRAQTVPETYELAVVIGLKRPDERPGLIDNMREAYGVADVQIVRYDELSEHGMKLHGRESLLLEP